MMKNSKRQTKRKKFKIVRIVQLILYKETAAQIKKSKSHSI